jgi:hypothetical protein
MTGDTPALHPRAAVAHACETGGRAEYSVTGVVRMSWWKAVALAGIILGAGAESVRGASAVAPAGFMLPEPDAPTRPASWMHFEGQKFRGPELQRSEAGITMPLSANVALQLRYERTALAPMMREDHDDGVLTRLRLAF